MLLPPIEYKEYLEEQEGYGDPSLSAIIKNLRETRILFAEINKSPTLAELERRAEAARSIE